MFEVHHTDHRPLAMQMTSENTSVQMGLGDHEMVTLTPPRTGLEIEAIEGEVWLTQAGDPIDHVLHAHQSFETHESGTVVVQGLTQATFCVRAPQEH